MLWGHVLTNDFPHGIGDNKISVTKRFWRFASGSVSLESLHTIALNSILRWFNNRVVYNAFIIKQSLKRFLFMAKILCTLAVLNTFAWSHIRTIPVTGKNQSTGWNFALVLILCNNSAKSMKKFDHHKNEGLYSIPNFVKHFIYHNLYSTISTTTGLSNRIIIYASTVKHVEFAKPNLRNFYSEMAILFIHTVINSWHLQAENDINIDLFYFNVTCLCE